MIVAEVTQHNPAEQPRKAFIVATDYNDAQDWAALNMAPGAYGDIRSTTRDIAVKVTDAARDEIGGEVEDPRIPVYHLTYKEAIGLGMLALTAAPVKKGAVSSEQVAKWYEAAEHFATTITAGQEIPGHGYVFPIATFAESVQSGINVACASLGISVAFDDHRASIRELLRDIVLQGAQGFIELATNFAGAHVGVHLYTGFKRVNHAGVRITSDDITPGAEAIDQALAGRDQVTILDIAEVLEETLVREYGMLTPGPKSAEKQHIIMHTVTALLERERRSRGEDVFI